jgi:hypothetical protein
MIDFNVTVHKTYLQSEYPVIIIVQTLPVHHSVPKTELSETGFIAHRQLDLDHG